MVPSEGGEPRPGPAVRRQVTVALLLVTALASMESTVVSTAMPTVIGELHGLSLYSWVFAVYLLASTLAMPVYGRLADVYGRRGVLLSAVGLFLSGALACGLARSMPALVAARALQGLGAGGLIPVSMTVAGDLFPLPERARVQALFSAVWGFASLAGPVAGAALTLALGWRSVFLVSLPFGLLALALVSRRLPRTAGRPAEPFDLLGTATLAVSMSLLLLSVLQPAGSGGPEPLLRSAFLAAGLAGLAAFLVVERRRAHPLVPPSLLSERATAAPYLAGLLLGTTIYGVDAFVPLFVQGALGGGPQAAGAVVTPLVLAWAVSATFGARAVVRFGFRATAICGGLLVVAGLASLLLSAQRGHGVLPISVACAVVGAGLGPSSIAQVLAVQNAAPQALRGVATSLVPFARTVGGSLGVGALGGILSHGLTARLGEAAAGTGPLLAGAGSGGTSAAARSALGGALLPVFGVLLALGAIHLALAARFVPGEAVPRG